MDGYALRAMERGSTVKVQNRGDRGELWQVPYERGKYGECRLFVQLQACGEV